MPISLLLLFFTPALGSPLAVRLKTLFLITIVCTSSCYALLSSSSDAIKEETGASIATKKRQHYPYHHAYAYITSQLPMGFMGCDPYSEIQMLWYFNLTANIINEKAYFTESYNCLSDKIIKCNKDLNKVNRAHHQALFLHSLEEINAQKATMHYNSNPKPSRIRLGLGSGGFSAEEMRMQNPHGSLNPLVLNKFTRSSSSSSSSSRSSSSITGVASMTPLSSHRPGEKASSSKPSSSSLSTPPPSSSSSLAGSDRAHDSVSASASASRGLSIYPNSLVHVHTKDCVYQASLVSKTLSLKSSLGSKALIVRLDFDIIQYNCVYQRKLPHLRGGSTFEVFLSNHARRLITRCNQIDFLNNSYRSYCEFELAIDSGESASMSISKNANSDEVLYCFNASILLEFEHFDSYSESLYDWSSAYPPLFHHHIWDNRRVCLSKLPGFDSFLQEVKKAITTGSELDVIDKGSDSSSAKKKGSQPSQQTPSSSNRNLGKSSRNVLRWYTGKWLRPVSNSNKDSTEQYINIASYFNDSHLVVDSEQLENEVEILKNRAVKYRPTLLQELKSSNNTSATTTDYSSGFFQSGHSEFSSFEIRASSGASFRSMLADSAFEYEMDRVGIPSIADKVQLRNKFAKMKMKYIFMGASHIRYLFDAVLVFFSDIHELNNVDRKHGNHRSIDEKLEFISSVYSHNQSNFLREICSNGGSSSCNSPITIVLQTGDWDLSIAPLRRVVHYDLFGKLLLSTIQMIHNGSIPCPCLEHFVWITAVPYPLCRNVKDPYLIGRNQCNSDRSYRSNHAISALNRFYLKGLDSMFDPEATTTNRKTDATASTSKTTTTAVRRKKEMRVSVVDAFAIIAPRLLFSDQFETVCSNHFICRTDISTLPEVSNLLSNNSSSSSSSNYSGSSSSSSSSDATNSSANVVDIMVAELQLTSQAAAMSSSSSSITASSTHDKDKDKEQGQEQVYLAFAPGGVALFKTFLALLSHSFQIE